MRTHKVDEFVKKVQPLSQSRLPAVQTEAKRPLNQISAPIAQLVEHLICNQGVRGSSPCGGTTFINKINYLD